MSKARRKTHKTGSMNRLVRESLILSCTRKLSSRFVRFFESGFASPLLTSAKKVNRFVRQRVTGPIFNKLGVRRNIAMPARNSVAGFVENNAITRFVIKLRDFLLNASMRTAGVFMFTFGLYAAAIYVLKNYVSLGGYGINPDDFTVASVVLLFGLILTMFGDKKILTTLGNSKIVGPLLYNSLGINDSSFIRRSKDKMKSAIGYAFLCGTLFGSATLFVAPIKVLLFLLYIITFAVIINIPEFGILLAVITLSFLPAGVVSAISSITLLSYFFKCVRLKRNFRFGTADAMFLLTYACLFVASAVSGADISQGESYLLTFAALYFAVKNSLCSEKLVVQTFNALCLSAEIGMALYILGDFATLIPYTQLRKFAILLSQNTMSPQIITVLVAAALPFALSSFSKAVERKPRRLFLLLALGTAVAIDSIPFYVMLVVSILVYTSFAYKAPFGAVLGGAIIIPPMLVIAKMLGVSGSESFFGEGRIDACFEIAKNLSLESFWAGLFEVGGAVSSLLLVLSGLLIFQRVIGSYVGENGTPLAIYGGTVTASAVMMVVCTFGINMFADVRILALLWFILGLCGSVYKLAYRPNVE